MFPWLWFYSPQIHYPWSGAVAQQIEPSIDWFFKGIDPSSGNARVEKKAFDVASYGRQLGLVTEILVDLAEQSQPTAQLSAQAQSALQRLIDIQADIERIKQDEAGALVRDVENQIDQLKRNNPAAFEDLRQRLRLALA